MKRSNAIQQKDGVLIANPIADSEDTFAGIGSDWLLSELDYVEADLMLDRNFDGQFGAVSLGLASNHTDFDDSYWFLSCHIRVCKTASWCTSPDVPMLTCFSPDGYDALLQWETEYNIWHTVRIDIDSSTGTFNISFDGKHLDSFTPSKSEELKDDIFRVEVGAIAQPESSITGYIDNVRIKTK